MFNFLHTYTPKPELFSIGGISIHWYGLMIVTGAIIGLLTVVRLAKIYKIHADLVYNLSFYVIIFGLLCDRLYYVIYNWQYYSQHLGDVYKIWEGGLAIHGAIIGGVLVILYFGRKYKMSPWLLLDLVCVALMIGLGFGRWGNYFNQELFGTPTTLPWGIPIELLKRPAAFVDFQYFHPTFLYESILDFLLAGILILMHYLRSRRNLRIIPVYGTITLTFFIGYGCIRFFTEQLRTDYTPYIFGMRWFGFASIIMVVIATGLLVWKLLVSRKVQG